MKPNTQQIDILIPEEKIEKRVIELAYEISTDYAGKDLLIVSVLSGSFIFCADLVRNITIHCFVDFVRAKSYRGINSGGKVDILSLLNQDIKGRHILIVEDIVDSGATLSTLMETLLAKNPKSIKVCTLLDKKEAREVDIANIDYIGFEIKNKFVVGYGLDYNGYFRGLAYIGVLNLPNTEKGLIDE